LWQVPFVPQVLASLVGHWLSAVPFATLEQVPAEPFRLQAWQAPVQADVQQTPWAQYAFPSGAA
jgi:hypothetical protein